MPSDDFIFSIDAMYPTPDGLNRSRCLLVDPDRVRPEHKDRLADLRPLPGRLGYYVLGERPRMEYPFADLTDMSPRLAPRFAAMFI